MNIELNDFQTRFVDEIEKQLASRSILFTKELKKLGTDNYVLFNIRHVQAFIYPNEAQIQGEGIDERYEPVDFSNNPSMMTKFVNELLLFVEDKTLRSEGFLKQVKKWFLSLLKVF